MATDTEPVFAHRWRDGDTYHRTWCDKAVFHGEERTFRHAYQLDVWVFMGDLLPCTLCLPQVFP